MQKQRVILKTLANNIKFILNQALLLVILLKEFPQEFFFYFIQKY
jgi:hypothetical protein